MSLRTDYALTTAILAAYDAGKAWVGTAAAPGPIYSAISLGLSTAAAQGKEIFTINAITSYNTVALRLKNKFMQAYFDGIYAALSAEGIMNYEVSLVLNTSDTINTSVDFNFSF